MKRPEKKFESLKMKSTKKAFTLVEVLIVVILLGIIAVIALPKFSNATAKTRANMLADDLRMLRTQTVVFKGQHCGISPGYPDCDPDAEPTQTAFINHMTMSSDQGGKVAAVGTSGYRYGPYFSKMPENPVNGLSTVQIVADDGTVPTTGDDSHGWIYQPSTLSFKADSSGADEDGKKYIDY